MRKAAAASLVCFLFVLLAGCSTGTLLLSSADRALRKRYLTSDHPANPVPALSKVGVVVLDATVEYHPDMAELQSALYGELQQVLGLEVIPNRIVLATIAALQNRAPAPGEDAFVLPRDGLRLSDELSADGVLLAIVTDYRPYGEPVVAVCLTLFSRATPAISPVDLDRVRQGGRPLEMPTEPKTKPVTAVFGVYDASQQEVRKRLKWFAEGRSDSDQGLGWERYYRSMPRYMRFVSYEIVWKLLDHLLVDQSLVQETKR